MNVDIEEGYQLEISNFAYKVITNVTQGSSTMFTVDHFFAKGSKSLTLKKSYTSDESDDIVEEGVVVSSCGGSENFRINTSLTAKRGSADGVAQIALAKGEPIYDINVVSCTADE